MAASSDIAVWTAALAVLSACDEESTPPPPPPEVCELPQGSPYVVALEGGIHINLALMSDGRMLCWGSDDFSACANEAGYSPLRPWPYESEGVSCLRQIFHHGLGVVGLSASGATLVWGRYSDTTVTPVDEYSVGTIELDGTKVRAATATNSFVLLATDEALFWQGVIAINGITDLEVAPTPTRIDLPGRTVSVAGYGHACALLEVGDLYCWGYGRVGELGLGVGVSAADPALVPAPGPLREVVAGFSSTCALGNDGAVFCTGNNVQGLLVGSAYGDNVGQLTRVEGLPPIDHLWANDFRICGTSSGELWCLGDPPAKVEGISDVVDVSLNNQGTCVMRSDGAVLCSGDSTGLGNCLESKPGWNQVDFTLTGCPGMAPP